MLKLHSSLVRKAFQVELKGRMPLAASANKSATADMVEKMKQKDYLEMVEPKLQDMLGEAASCNASLWQEAVSEALRAAWQRCSRHGA